jgi:hypothetical protein
MADDSVMGLLQALGMGNMQSLQATPGQGPAPFTAQPAPAAAAPQGGIMAALTSLLQRAAPMAGGGSPFMGGPSQVSGALSPAFSMQPQPQQPAAPPAPAAAASPVVSPTSGGAATTTPAADAAAPPDPAFSTADEDRRKVKTGKVPASEVPKGDAAAFGMSPVERTEGKDARHPERIVERPDERSGMVTAKGAKRQEEPNLLQKLGSYLTDPKDRNMWLGIASGFGGAPSFGIGLGKAAAGMAAGSRQDIAEQSLNQTQAALMARGATLEEAKAAASNPALLQQWLKEHAVGYGKVGETGIAKRAVYEPTIGGIPASQVPPVRVNSPTEVLKLQHGQRFIIPSGQYAGQIGVAP